MLDANALERLELSPERRMRREAGQYLFRTGDAAVVFLTVVLGRVRLERVLADGSVVCLHRVLPGDTMAEAALFTGVFRCDAVAELPSTVDVYSASGILSRLESHPEILVDLSRRLANQLVRARDLLEIRNIRSARQRLLAYLALGRDSSSGPLRLIADEIGLAPETLYRALASLVSSGEVKRSGRHLELPS